MAKKSPTRALIDRLAEVSQALEKRSKKMEAELGITGPQRLALQLIGKQPGLTAAEAAQQMHLHPSTVTGVLQRLEGRGLLLRMPDELDGRKLLLSLTGEGLALFQKRSSTLEDALDRALAGLDPRDVEATDRVLGKIAVSLGTRAAGRSAPHRRRRPGLAADRGRPGPRDRPASAVRRSLAPSPSSSR